MFAAVLFGLIIYDCLPAQMPIHWNIAGEIDNYASKEIFVFLLPILMSGIQLLCLFMMQMDPKYKNYSSKMLKIVVWIIPIDNNCFRSNNICNRIWI